MLQYVFNTDLEDDEPMMFCAEEQCWDEATLKQLREEYNIIFGTSGDAVIPVMIIYRDTNDPVFVLGSEDDGTIVFERKYGQFRNIFSSYWAAPLISDLDEAMRVCNKKTALPYTHIEELNPIVTELMNDWYDLVKKAKSHGMDIRFAPNCTETLGLYFHDDYPDMLLIDKEVSCKTA